MTQTKTVRLPILAVCYHYPPVGSAGVARSIRLLPLLPSHGVDPTVVTIDPAGDARKLWRIDEELLHDVRSIATIRIVDNGFRHRPGMSFPRLNKYLWMLAYPWLLDYAAAWSDRVARRAGTLISSSRARAVYVSAPPFSSIVAARRIARSADIPLVVDYRDPWTTASLVAHPSRLHFWLESRVERRILSEAAEVIVNTAASADALTCSFPELHDKVTVIPNVPPRMTPGSNRLGESAAFRIVFAGTLYEDRTRASRFGQFHPGPIDDGTRSIRPLLSALDLVRTRHPAEFSRLDIRFAGRMPTSAVDATHGYPIRFEGELDQAQVEGLMNSANALLVNQVAWQDRSSVMPHIPGKVYEYLATGLPILAPVTDGALADLLRADAANAFVCNVDDPQSICDALVGLVRDGRRREPDLRFTPSAGQAAEDLAAVLRSAVDRHQRD